MDLNAEAKQGAFNALEMNNALCETSTVLMSRACFESEITKRNLVYRITSYNYNCDHPCIMFKFSDADGHSLAMSASEAINHRGIINGLSLSDVIRVAYIAGYEASNLS